MQEGYRDPAGELSRGQRMDRLENAVAKFSARKVYETLRWGFVIMLVLIGLGGAAFGFSFLWTSLSDSWVVETQTESETAAAALEREARQHEIGDAPRAAARAECDTACQNVGMAIERCRIVSDTPEGYFRPASCFCASNDGRTRTLWNDLISNETKLRRRCAQACEEAGMGMQRAVIRGGEVVACGCVSSSSHRTLWDDRRSPACEISSQGGIVHCELPSGAPVAL